VRDFTTTQRNCLHVRAAAPELRRIDVAMRDLSTARRTMNDTQYDVAVVGCGPVGLTLVGLLAGLGLRVAAIDSSRLICKHPRATHVDDETMRTLQIFGFAEWEPRFLRFTRWQMFDASGRRFASLRIPTEPTDQGWWSDYMFHQPDYEARMRGRAVMSEFVTTWFGWQAQALMSSERGVELTVVDNACGSSETITASYVVGADGAHSFVRAAVETSMEDLHGTQRSLIVDIEPLDEAPNLPQTEGFIYCEPRPVTFVPIYPPLRRFEFMLRPEDDARELERPENIYRLLTRWTPPDSYRILRTDVYEWHSRLATGWRHGRTLLAGDAAHEMPPMLGQGMCSGIRDAMNLAWKLAFVCRGDAPVELLDTYEAERAPHVRPFIEESARQANLVEELGAGAADSLPDTEQIVVPPRPPIGPGVTAATPDAGVLWIQPIVGDGDRLDDQVGYRFLVTGTAEALAQVGAQTRAAWGALDAAVVPAGAQTMAWLAERGRCAVIVRPDRYVFGVAEDASHLERLTEELGTNFGWRTR
jgi:3-(3-hydroxy-phenyl)propionate hydroxylase